MQEWFRQGQPLRFLIVGALNSLFGYAVFSGIVLLGGPAWGAVLGGNAAGLVFNFFTHGGLVFRQLSLTSLPRFTACYAALLCANILLLRWLEPLAGGKLLAQALLTAPLAVLAYVLMSRWVFRRATAPKAPP
jgi:putative flippase GtrA